MPIVSRSPRKARWYAWSGTSEELHKIGGQLDALVEKRRTALLSNLQQDTAEGEPSTYEKMRIEGFVIDAIYNDGKDEHHGPTGEILDMIDPRSTKSLMLLALSHRPPVHEKVSLAFFKSSGVMLDVESRDRAWAGEVRETLSDEIRKGVPRWAWIKSTWGGLIFGIGTFIFFYVSTIIALYRHFDSSIAVALAALAVGIVAQVLVSFPPMASWLLPVFEIRSDSQSTGSRRVALVLAAAATAPIALLVNWLSG